ncbi:hypothetical protein [uncultured Oscillibacter sp.]|uniref:hypothetical protein n=1 Tax=uncultured Oscillibacter sp. TaxID=876091 RepID=UPI0025E0DD9A|nr:hypothetical protein [uncultured Oscillibacter sp.]
MNEELREYLWDGEVVRWSGRSAPVPLLSQRERGKILVRWAITLVCISTLLGIYSTGSGALSGKFAALVTLVAALVIAMPWLERWSVMGMKYFVTDRRAILLTRDKSVYYMELDEVDDVKRVCLQPEADALVMGSAIFEDADRQPRFRACNPKTDLQSAEGQDRAAGLVFYGLRDAEFVEALLRRSASDERAEAI